MSDDTAAPRSRPVKKSGNGLTIAVLVLVLAAAGFLGYYAFIETGAEKPGLPVSVPSPAVPVSQTP